MLREVLEGPFVELWHAIRGYITGEKSPALRRFLGLQGCYRKRAGDRPAWDLYPVLFLAQLQEEWRRSSGNAAFRSRGARSLVHRGDQASAGRVSIAVDGSSWSLARPPDARWEYVASTSALPLGS